MDSKEFGLVAAQQLFKVEDLHYGYWDKSEDATLSNWITAQEKHTNFLFKYIYDKVIDKKQAIPSLPQPLLETDSGGLGIFNIIDSIS